jgi:hypothetical protein
MPAEGLEISQYRHWGLTVTDGTAESDVSRYLPHFVDQRLE